MFKQNLIIVLTNVLYFKPDTFTNLDQKKKKTDTYT